MSVRIEIDKQGSVFTCLDLITGRVVFNVGENTTGAVSSINVKLEGVSKTRLLVPKGNEVHDNSRSSKRAHIEIHKLLYQVETVFPPEQIRKSQEAAGISSETDFTLPAGTHTYPFSFRIPINNCCRPLDSLFSKLSVKEGNLEYARDAEHHTKNTLPPSIYSLPGESQGEGGSIRYYIKATVNRPQFYRINVRKEAFFAFLPIDPPRAAAQGEIFARREHLLHFPLLTPSIKKKGFWGKSKKPEIKTPLHPNEEPRFTIEARLASPPVLVPKEPLGLRIIMTKLVPFKTSVVLSQIQLRLFMTTFITAHEHSKKVTFTLPLFNTSTDYRLGMPIPHIFGPTDALPGAQLEADPRIWENWVLPENISPSFRTCNIARSYQLEVTLGVSLGENAVVDQIPLLIPIEVYTGFTPSAKLLAALNYQTNPQLSDPKLFLPRQYPTQQHLRVNSYPTPSSPLTSSSSRPSSATFPSKPFPTTTNTNQPSSPSTLQVPFPNSYRTNGYEPPPPTCAYTEPPTSRTTISPIPSPESSTFPQSQSQVFLPSSPSYERKGSFTGSGTGEEIWQPVQPQQTVHMAMADAPPTYEDAVLREIDDVDIMVADGPRREYPLQPGYFEGDGKRASRLFAS